MEKKRKRKQEAKRNEERNAKSVKASQIQTENENLKEPFPSHSGPTPQECLDIRDTLLALHGLPPELAKYRKSQQQTDDTINPDPPETVLDGLVRTILSQNTTESNSNKAFASLKSSFPTWEHVHGAESKELENAIRCGGLAPTKASCIKNLLRCLLEKRGKFCLEYLRDLSVAQIKAELSLFKGIGPKTVACVLMFNLQQDDFPVDTHIFEIAKTIGWVPAVADRNKTYLHLNQRIPNELKFDLNCLLYTHGKFCSKCSSKRGNKQQKKFNDNSCPLLNYYKEPV
ncbi:putative DNA glycosylase At3g47830 [Cicer arietinum]|uniref:DNA glycosylase At3g47830 n=1 Tax=Cicer arietinum TaxID=3827 RepID=A0A1S2YRN0_CICAR|nr:putative DNA glycosylase At3g47830 [Cicer arietinum]XP_004508836.1 putative DNA glycosylase At3g47830 [Cicer arietinum]